MNRLHKVTVANTAGFLKELHDSLKSGKKVVISKLFFKYHITSRVSIAIQDLGIIEKLSKGRYLKSAIWKVGEPNLKLAETVVKRCTLLNHDYNYMKRDKIVNDFQNKLTGDSNAGKTLPSDIQYMIEQAVKKALAPPVKIRKVLKFRNPFYWEEI